MQTTEMQPISEGKTKRIFPIHGSSTSVRIESKNDITAGDGAKHDVIEGKAELATRTTCNVFRLLRECQIPVAWEKQDGPTTFLAAKCDMLPYEVVIRREAHGSYLKRSPHLMKGHIFPRLVLEFYLKTSGKNWKGKALACDDPLMSYGQEDQCVHLFDPKQPFLAQKPAECFLSLPECEVFSHPNEKSLLARMGDIARQVFLILEKAWQIQGRKLVDFKVEFGVDTEGRLRLADVIDNDSWRVVDRSGRYIDKQSYRDGATINEVTARYREVADITDRFNIPFQRLIVWRGSPKDKFTAVEDFVSGLQPWPKFSVLPVTCSVHKQPVLAYRLLQRHLQEEPGDCVIIACVGRSNGAGPVLAANSTVPVITVPAGYNEFPEDVWSSLRMPSNVPVMTVLDPGNAVQAALQILAIRNPSIYAALRFKQEERLSEVADFC